MFALYRAKTVRQAKRTAESTAQTQDWMKKKVEPQAIPANTISPQSDSDYLTFQRPNINSTGWDKFTDDELEKKEIRELVEKRIGQAWEVLKNPSLGNPLKSREEYHQRKEKLDEVRYAMNNLVLVCEQYVPLLSDLVGFLVNVSLTDFNFNFCNGAL
jgi:hypothetical protein